MRTSDWNGKPYPENEIDKLEAVAELILMQNGGVIEFDRILEVYGWDLDPLEEVNFQDLIKNSNDFVVYQEVTRFFYKLKPETLRQIKGHGNYRRFREAKEFGIAKQKLFADELDRKIKMAESRKRWRDTHWVWIEIGKVVITTILSTLLVLAINKMFK
ncbi:MAG: hypothetical protein ACTHMM_12000 [Agriterribacter sp.]